MTPKDFTNHSGGAIGAWEILPRGSYPPALVGHWLSNSMKPMIENLRHGTVPAYPLENIK